MISAENVCELGHIRSRNDNARSRRPGFSSATGASPIVFARLFSRLEPLNPQVACARGGLCRLVEGFASRAARRKPRRAQIGKADCPLKSEELM